MSRSALPGALDRKPDAGFLAIVGEKGETARLVRMWAVVVGIVAACALATAAVAVALGVPGGTAGAYAMGSMSVSSVFAFLAARKLVPIRHARLELTPTEVLLEPGDDGPGFVLSRHDLRVQPVNVIERPDPDESDDVFILTKPALRLSRGNGSDGGAVGVGLHYPNQAWPAGVETVEGAEIRCDARLAMPMFVEFAAAIATNLPALCDLEFVPSSDPQYSFQRPTVDLDGRALPQTTGREAG